MKKWTFVVVPVLIQVALVLVWLSMMSLLGGCSALTGGDGDEFRIKVPERPTSFATRSCGCPTACPHCSMACAPGDCACATAKRNAEIPKAPEPRMFRDLRLAPGEEMRDAEWAENRRGK